ncbi:transglycosylase SLT domain-containing protein [Kineococcus glutinatus]|uniref:NlpC/P60 domain-containing protein n=1 Tax=Kineococcus glutinatus TaxID=1070872 RepID=A0ABP8VFU8_9ACTN
MSGIAEVQARIGDIQSRIATLAGWSASAGLGGGVLGATTGTTGTTATTATTGAGFADVLSASSPAVARGTRTTVPATTTTTAAGTAATGEALVATARKYLGVPYVWGGTDPAKGLDCSGLVQLVARENGITVPRTAAQQAKAGTEVPSLAEARPGDLVVLSGGSHIGIYVGNGQMLHAPKAGDVVKIAKVWETPMTIRRLGAAAATGAAVATASLTGAAGVGAADQVRPAALAATSSTSAPYDAAFAAAEQRYGLPTGLLSAVAKQESGYNPNAKSPAGAQGLMQFMPATAREMGIDPLDPAQAIDGAGRLLSKHLSSFGSVSLALAAYNAGPGNVRKYGGIPPFTETQNYVKKITATLGSTA